jgi:CRP/FNR family transcriptional regulator, cyclic AMP receptor protein
MPSLMAAVTSAGRFKAFPESAAARHVDGRASLPTMGRIKPEGAAQDEVSPDVARAVADGRKQRIRDALADSDLFGALADDALDGLIRQGRLTTHRSGAIIFRKGDPAEDLMLVLHGRVKLSSASMHGKEVIFDFIGPGRCLGEMALLEGKARKLDATAVKQSDVFMLRRRDALACIERHPEVAVRTIRMLCARLSRAMEVLEERAQLGLPARTARALLRLASEYGSHEGDVLRIGLKISQGEIAALVGATRETVNRQLCAWCRLGILVVDEGHLTIHRPAALQSAANQG